MINNDLFGEVLEILSTPDVFFDSRNQTIFSAMKELGAFSLPLDLPSVLEKLKTGGKLDAAGGESYLGKLIGETLYISDAINIAGIIKQDYIRRQIIDISNQMSEESYGKGEVDSILESAEKRIFELSNANQKKGFVNFEQVLAEAIKEIYDRANSSDRLRGISTGYTGIDAYTLGLRKGEFILIAARPSMGKTALALNICQNVARDGGVVAIFSLEMDAKSLTERIIASEARVSLANHMAAKEHDSAIRAAAERIANYKLRIEETSGMSIHGMRSRLRQLKMKEKSLDLIMIDYIQLMEADGKENRQQEVSYISRSLKAIAKEFDCPVLALSQLSRSSEKRGVGKKPILSDLRESGAIEQDADVVMFIHRPEYYLREKTPPELMGVAEIIFAKQRNGKTGTLYMTWSSEITKFDNMADEDAEAAIRVSKD